MFRTARIALLTAVSTALLACASDLPVGISFDPLERFPAEASWRWDEARNVLPDDPRLAPMQLGAVLRDVVGSELGARGYREAGGETADYLVSYELRLTTRVRPESSVSVASFSLLLREARSERRVWVAFVQTDIDVTRSDAQRRERIRAVVREMLKDFPPGRA